MERRIIVIMMTLLTLGLPSTAFADLAPLPPEGRVSKLAILGIVVAVIVAVAIIKVVFTKKKK